MSAANESAVGDVTQMLRSIQAGQPQAGDELIKLVYAELRRIAGAMMRREQPSQTLQPTALVHEAWLRLGSGEFENRGHFFSAAAEAMRRILIERARRRQRAIHGAGAEHCELGNLEIAAPIPDEELLAVNEAVDQLAQHDARKAELVKLRYFVGLSFAETAEALGISEPTAHRDWAYARAWLHHAIGQL